MGNFTQGVSGKVLWLEGNQMPRIGNASRPKPKGIQRVVIAYPLVKISELDGQPPLFEKPDAEPVAAAESNEDGEFTLGLPTGSYSIFVEEKGQLFANSFEGSQGHVSVVKVVAGEFTEVEIVVNYKASY